MRSLITMAFRAVAVTAVVTLMLAAVPNPASASVDYYSYVAHRNRATLHLVGEGFQPGDSITLEQQASIPGGYVLRRAAGQVTVIADATGSFEVDFPVVKRFKAPCSGSCAGRHEQVTKSLNCVVHTCYVYAFAPLGDGGSGHGFAFSWTDF